VAKFTALIPLSLLISSQLSFQIVSLKMSSLPTLASKSPNKIFILYLVKLLNTFQFLAEHSEQDMTPASS
jgi:hypothetical protein